MKTLWTTLLVAGLSLPSVAVEVRGDANAGRNKRAMCSGCHGIPGYQSSFPEVYRVPLIGGQSARYLVAALTAYRKGERRHPSMVGIAKGLTDQDIADLAAYYALQK
jgi:cytochrome c553